MSNLTLLADADGGMMNGDFGMMRGYGMMGGPFFGGFFGLLWLTTWVLVVVLLVVMIRYFWQKTDSKK